MLDVVEVGPNGSPVNGRRRRWLAAALAFLLVLGLLAAWGDRWLSHRESSSLARCVATSESALGYADARVVGMGTYIGAALGSAESAKLRQGLLALVADAAVSAEPAVRKARSGCHAGSVFYTHRQLGAARSAYLRYLDAKADYLHTITLDGHQAYVAPKTLPALRADARDALDSALHGKDHAAVDAALGAT